MNLADHATFVTVGPEGFKVVYGRKKGFYRVILPPNQPIIAKYNSDDPYRVDVVPNAWNDKLIPDFYNLHLIHVLGKRPTQKPETFTMP